MSVSFRTKRCLEGKCVDFFYLCFEWKIYFASGNVSKNRNTSNIKSPFFLLIEILRPNLWVVQLKILDSFRFTTASWTSNITKGLVTSTFTTVAKIYRYNISLMPEAWRRGLGWSITCFVSPIKECFWRQQMTFAFFLPKLNLSSMCPYYLF